ncbi:MAG: proteasome accessory factor PafA2 family protein, partial [Propionicimonas sp.]|nr:proteasome accessory factor PafA2 family protein [Propionicimonas sp.]
STISLIGNDGANILVSGAGRVGIGQHGQRPGFQLSQRADFFETTEGIETTRRRPVVNTRDEPHARPDRYRRLHVITGDANRSAWSTWLKVGTAAAVLAALEDGSLPEFRLADPVAAMHAVSHRPWEPLALADGRRLTALDLQSAYLEAALAHAGRVGGDGAVLRAWQEVLDDLRADPGRCADRLDWAAKAALLSGFAERHGLPEDSPRLAQLDLAWAELGHGSPFDALLRGGRFRPLPFSVDVAAAVADPPADTRAWLRGRVVRERPDAVVATSWDWLVLRDPRGRRIRLDLSEPLDPGNPDAVLRSLGG